MRLAPDLAFTRPGGTAGLVIEWGSHVQDDDPRFGAPVPVFVVLPVVNVELHGLRRRAGARSRARRRAARRGARHRPGGLRPRTAPDVPHFALDLGDCMLALYPVPPDETTSRAVWGGLSRPATLPRTGVDGDRSGRRRARARRRAGRRPPSHRRRTGRARSERAAVPGAAHRGAAPRRSPHPDVTGGLMAERDERLWNLLEPSTTAVLTMELQNGIVGEGAHAPGAASRSLQRAGTLDTVRRVCDAARARRRARGALHRGVTRRRRGRQRATARSSPSPARQRREQGHGATDLGTSGAELVAGPRGPARHRGEPAPRHDAVHLDVARPDPAQPRDPHRGGDGRLGEPRCVRHGDVGASTSATRW